MNKELVKLLREENDRWDLTSDQATIRCVAHIIHLAVSEVLVALKVVKRPSGRAEADLGDLTEEMAEEIGFEEPLEEASRDDEAIMEEQRFAKLDEYSASAFGKVCNRVLFIPTRDLSLLPH